MDFRNIYFLKIRKEISQFKKFCLLNFQHFLHWEQKFLKIRPLFSRIKKYFACSWNSELFFSSICRSSNWERKCLNSRNPFGSVHARKTPIPKTLSPTSLPRHAPPARACSPPKKATDRRQRRSVIEASASRTSRLLTWRVNNVCLRLHAHECHFLLAWAAPHAALSGAYLTARALLISPLCPRRASRASGSNPLIGTRKRHCTLSLSVSRERE